MVSFFRSIATEIDKILLIYQILVLANVHFLFPTKDIRKALLSTTKYPSSPVSCLQRWLFMNTWRKVYRPEKSDGDFSPPLSHHWATRSSVTPTVPCTNCTSVFNIALWLFLLWSGLIVFWIHVDLSQPQHVVAVSSATYWEENTISLFHSLWDRLPRLR